MVLKAARYAFCEKIAALPRLTCICPVGGFPHHRGGIEKKKRRREEEEEGTIIM